MPQVPRYDRQQVELNPLPRAGAVPPPAYAAGAAAGNTTALARGLDAFGDSMDRLAIQQSNEEAFSTEARAKQAWIEYSAELQKNRQGASAKGVAADAGKWWDENGAKFAEGATTGRAQRMVKQSLQRMQLAAVNEFKGFELRQGEIAADAAFEANVKSSISAIAANPSTENMALHRTGIAAAMREQAAARGWAPEVLNDKMATAQSAATIAAFNTVLARSPIEARDFWAANRETVRGEQRDEIDNRLKTAVATVEANAKVDEVWRELGPKKDMDPVELDKMGTRVRELFRDQPETLKAAQAALRERAMEFNSAQAERKAGATNDVMAVWQSTKSMAAVKASTAWGQLPATEQSKIEEHITNVQTAALNRANAQAGRDILAFNRDQQRLQQQNFGAYLAYSDPRALAGMTRTQVQALQPTLGNELTGHLLTRWDAMQTADGKRTASIDKDDFNEIARQFKLPVDKIRKSEQEAGALGTLQFRVEQMIDMAQAGKKAPLTRQEKLELMRTEMGKQVLLDGWFTNTSKPVIELTPEDVSSVIVPPVERKALTEAMQVMHGRVPESQRAQFAPTEENLKRFYLMHKSRGAASLIPRKDQNAQ
jgi:hypothetical protein